jgi:hypothetical protein
MIIRQLCASVIATGIINASNLNKALGCSEAGKKLAQSFDMDVIINRVKYERRLHRKKQ